MSNLPENVVIIAASGFGREVLDVFIAANSEKEKWNLLGFIDEDPKLHGKVLNDYRVLGSFDWLTGKNIGAISAICAVGDNKIRRKLVEKATSYGLKFCSIRHPQAVITNFVSLGEGSVICPGAVITNTIDIGKHVIVNINATIGHDVEIENFANINPGAHINGNVSVGEGAFIGSGAVVVQGLTIGEWSIVGAGAVVTKNIPAHVTAVGIPAKVISRHSQSKKEDKE